MGSFLGVTAVQWQNGLRVAIGVLILSTLGLMVTHYAQRHTVWCAWLGGMRNICDDSCCSGFVVAGSRSHLLATAVPTLSPQHRPTRPGS